MTTSSFGSYLLQLRQRRRLLQKQVAATAGFDPSYVASLERGRRIPPRRELIDRLLFALNANTAERERLISAAAADRLAHAIARHQDQIEGAGVLSRIATCLPRLQPEDLVTLERVVIGFTTRSDADAMERRDSTRKEKTA